MPCFDLPDGPAVPGKCGGFILEKLIYVCMCSKQYENMHTSILGWTKRLKKIKNPFRNMSTNECELKKHVLYIMYTLMSLEWA